MARRDGTEKLTFELVPDDDVPVPGTPSPAPGSPATVPPSVLNRSARGVLAWLRGRTRGQLVAGIVALAILAGGGVTATVLRDRAAVQTLRSSPGGVADLSVPVRQLWSRTYDVADDGVTGRVETSVWTVGVLDAGAGRDIVVVMAADPDLSGPPSLAANEPRQVNTLLHGLDLDTGEEYWQVPIEGTATCGLHRASLSDDRVALPTAVPHLVCTTGEGAQSRVVVVAPDGSVTERTPDELDERSTVVPGPNGSVLRVDSAGPDPQGVRLEQTARGAWRFTAGFDAPVHRVTAEDAFTGEKLWHIGRSGGPVHETADPQRCASTGPDGTPRVDVAKASITVVDDGLVAQLCGVDLVISAAGAVVASYRTGLTEYVSRPVVLSLVGGGIGVVQTQLGVSWKSFATRPTNVYDRTGRLVLPLETGVLDPWATDGRGGLDLTGEPRDRGSGLLVTHDGQRVQALRSTGEVVWDVRIQPFVEGAIARADGVLVVLRRSLTGEAALVGLDLGSGVELWQASIGGFGIIGGGSWSYLRGAWTDGRVLVVATPGFYGTSAEPEWTAYDLRTGETAWHLDADAVQRVIPPHGLCLAVVGRLLCVDGTTVVRVA